MKKIASLVSALSLALVLSSTAFAGEMLTPGIAPPPPPPSSSVFGDEQIAGLAATIGEGSTCMGLIYDLLPMVI